MPYKGFFGAAQLSVSNEFVSGFVGHQATVVHPGSTTTAA